jgi:hypothetical protein
MKPCEQFQNCFNNAEDDRAAKGHNTAMNTAPLQSWLTRVAAAPWFRSARVIARPLGRNPYESLTPFVVCVACDA